MIRTLLFDMDGVLADFVRGSFRIHGKSLPISTLDYDYWSQMGLSGNQFWNPIKAAGASFWEGLEPLGDGMAVFSHAAGWADECRIAFLSSAALPGATDGKRAWLENHLPGWHGSLFTGCRKYLMASPCKLLIDDFDKNVDAFREHGGRAILVPRPWNTRRDACDSEGRFNVEGLIYEITQAIEA